MPIVPTRRLALVAVALGVVMLALPSSGPIGVLAINVALVVVAVIDALLAPHPGEVGLERELPGVLALGQVGEVRWQVHNPLRRRLRVSVADALAPSLCADRRRFVATVPASGRASTTTGFR